MNGMLPLLALGVWVLYLALVVPPFYRARCSGRARAELVHMLQPAIASDLPAPTISELQSRVLR